MRLSGLVLLASSFAVGIVLVDLCEPGLRAWLVLAGIGLTLLLLGRMWRVAAVVLAAVAGGSALALRLDAASDHQVRGELRASLEGTVESSVHGPRSLRITLREVANGEPAGPRLPVRVAVLAPLRQSSPLEQVRPGERWRIRARLRPPQARWNPGSRPGLERLRRQGVGAVALPVEPLLLARLPEREGWRVLAPIHELRSRASARLGELGSGGALLAALGLGERSALPWATRRAFAGLGLAHLLAVSGLHLALGASFVYALVRRALARLPGLAARADVRLLALAAAVAAAGVQALLSGWGVPVRRALVLLLATALAAGRGRPQRRSDALALAALWVLATDPAALFEPGAQLSFAASAALLFSARGEPAGGRLGQLEAALRTTATATAVTAPIVARALGGLAPLGLLANVVAVPWVGLVLLPAALLASLLAAMPPAAGAQALLEAASALADLTLACVQAAARMAPQAAPGRDPASVWWLTSVVVALAALGMRSTASRVAASLAVVAILWAAPPRALFPGPPRLVVLDVGHGDAVVAQGREAAVLVDGALALPDGTDHGERSVLPALAALGVSRLDLVVATHADLDHRGGLPAVMRGVPVGELWLPFGGLDDPDFTELVALAAAREVPVHERGTGSPPERLGDLWVEPLWPPPAGSSFARRSRNERSLVVRISAGRNRALLAGDVGAVAESGLARLRSLSAEILLLPHHGSRTSSSRALLEAVDPVLVVASASCGGRFGTPHPEVMERVRARGAPLWWTGRDGAVIVGLGARPVARGFGPVGGACWAQPRFGGTSAW